MIDWNKRMIVLLNFNEAFFLAFKEWNNIIDKQKKLTKTG